MYEVIFGSFSSNFPIFPKCKWQNLSRQKKIARGSTFFRAIFKQMQKNHMQNADAVDFKSFFSSQTNKKQSRLQQITYVNRLQRFLNVCAIFRNRFS